MSISPGNGGALERKQETSSLADVVSTILDKGIVIDVFARVARRNRVAQSRRPRRRCERRYVPALRRGGKPSSAGDRRTAAAVRRRWRHHRIRFQGRVARQDPGRTRGGGREA